MEMKGKKEHRALMDAPENAENLDPKDLQALKLIFYLMNQSEMRVIILIRNARFHR